MATYIFNGECPSGIKQTFIDTYKYQHTDTWYKYAGDTNWRKVSITGDISGSSSAPTTQIPTVTNVVALEIGSDVTYIGIGAFRYCSGLTSIVIPDSVTSIGYQAFYGCSGLITFEVSPENPAYKSVNGLLLSKNGKTLVAGINGNVIIPDSVMSIKANAFATYSGLTSVTISDSVTSIGQLAFNGCSGLTSIVIPDSVTSIGYQAFNGCSSLTSVVFKGKTLAEVQAMSNYSWNITDTSIITVI